MFEAARIRSFLFKSFVTLIIFCLCQIVYELVFRSNGIFKKSLTKRSAAEETDQLLLNLPDNLERVKFLRTKRINSTLIEPFIPTNEWQEIKPGQIVPSGLHYRINLETGKKEAKLLDESESTDSQTKNSQRAIILKDNQLNIQLNDELNNQPDQLNGQTNINSFEKLKNKFDKFKFDEKDEELNKVKKLNNWRSIDELKKEFESSNIRVLSESENVQRLLGRYQLAKSDLEKVRFLKELEFALHQYDVSGDFVKMKGLETIRADFLNNENNLIQSLISVVLGSAASGNPPVKIEILKSGLLDILINKLKHQNLDLNLKTIYAISSILRQFPYAQKQFIDQDGLKTFKKFFNDSNTAPSSENEEHKANLIKMQTKIVSLLSDLIEEHKNIENDLNLIKKKKKSIFQSEQLSNLQEKMNQYNQVNLEQHFLSEKFCSILPKNLNNSSYDVREKVLRSMNSFRSTCKNEFKTYLEQLVKFKNELAAKIETDKLNGDSDDEYYQSLIHLTQDLFEFLKN